MLKQEFEERIGRKADNIEYRRANEAYMRCDVDKDLFCKEWEAGLKDSNVLADIVRVAETSMFTYGLENQRRVEAEKEQERLAKENEHLQETINNLKARVEDLDDEAAEKGGRIMGLEERIEKLEAEKATLYKLLEKLLDK